MLPNVILYHFSNHSSYIIKATKALGLLGHRPRIFSWASSAAVLNMRPSEYLLTDSFLCCHLQANHKSTLRANPVSSWV